ncbi:YciI family protein [Pseudoxanthomonas gei]|uniref:YciI family protein n=1 Tax=Pseudoxanthomonas gei TaxID=1383030 RepID=A0ABX0AI12_9GAMM|nr:YciI family protein [Pseudoxanthomonas gei]NDK40090.1 YciI family protein [Pseudoxanthomonas gei]
MPQFLVLIYNDESLLGAMPEEAFDTTMHECFVHADALRAQGKLSQSMQLEAPATARTVRIRNGRTSVVDGPFAETKEMLGGFNLIEAADLDEAVRIASEFPWAETGCIEVRPVRDIDAVRRRVGA